MAIGVFQLGRDWIAGTLASINGKPGYVQAVQVTDGTGAATGLSSLGSTNLNTGQVSVGTTATLIAAARTGRNAITITNVTGAQQVYVGNSNAVSAATGTLLPAAVGASITLPYSGAVYGIAVTAAQTVSFAETY